MFTRFARTILQSLSRRWRQLPLPKGALPLSALEKSLFISTSIISVYSLCSNNTAIPQSPMATAPFTKGSLAPLRIGKITVHIYLNNKCLLALLEQYCNPSVDFVDSSPLYGCCVPNQDLDNTSPLPKGALPSPHWKNRSFLILPPLSLPLGEEGGPRQWWMRGRLFLYRPELSEAGCLLRISEMCSALC